jgi:archaellum biogenesis ATPase FlaH
MEKGTSSKSTYQDYINARFIPILCKGYHPGYNQRKEYKTAKEPSFSGWKKLEYVPPTLEKITGWEKAGGWIGWVVPKGIIALDVEDTDDISSIKEICRVKGLKPAIHKTNNGVHFFFATSLDLSAPSEVFTKCGVKVTPRVGGKNYVILAPTNNRSWESWISPDQLPILPDEFFPYNRKSIEEVLNCLSWSVRKAHRENYLAGYEDLDAAYMALLIDCKLSPKQIHQSFAITFGEEYDERQTHTMYERTLARIGSGDPVIGAGSFIQKIKELDLKEIRRFTRELQDTTHHLSNCPGIYSMDNTDRSDKGGLSRVSETDPLKVMRAGRVLQKIECSVTWVWDKQVPENSITLFSGKGGVGKTWLTLGIAKAVSRGVPFLGLSTRKLPVYYIDFENPLPMLIERIKKIGIEDVLFWHNADEVRPPKVDSIEWELYKKLSPGLLIIDTLRSSQHKDENDSKDMSFIMARLKELRDIGFTIVLLHHTPKSNDRTYKGSTAIFDLSDHVLALYKVRKGRPEEIIDDDDDEDVVYRIGTKDKTRYEPFHIFIMRDPELGFVLAPDPDTDDLEAIWAILKEHPRMNQSQVWDAAKERLGMKSKGIVVSLLKKGTGMYWDVTSDGRARFYMAKEPVQVSSTIYSRTIGQIEGTEINLSRQVEGMDRSNPPVQSTLSNCPDSLQTDETVKSFNVKTDCQDRPLPFGKCEKYKMKYFPESRELEKFCMVRQDWCWTVKDENQNRGLP